MKHLILFLLVMMALVLPTAAQDATAEVEPTNQDVEVVSGEGAEVVATEAADNGTTVIVNQPATEDSDSNDDYVTSFLIGGLLLIVVFFSGFAITIVSQLVPAGAAKELIETGVKTGFQMALNNAASTKTTIDDDVYTALAKVRGLDVTKDASGNYVVTLRPNSSLSSTGVSFDTTATHG